MMRLTKLEETLMNIAIDQKILLIYLKNKIR